MSDIRITLEPEALREATMQAIMGVLTPEMRSQMIEKAIAAILAPSNNSWDNKRSMIEVAFTDAVTGLARRCAAEVVSTDAALKARMDELMRQTMDRLLERKDYAKEGGKDLASRMADALVDSIGRDR